MRFIRRSKARSRRGRRLLVAALGLLVGALVWQVVTWPDVAALAHSEPETTAFIERFERQRREEGLEAEVAWRWVDYDDISIHFKQAVLVSEDIAFFSHRGFALEEIEIALREAWAERKPPRGASTITQQLAKNLWLSPARSPLRKLEEAILTWQLERHLDKQRILELYMNVVELGQGIYGVEAAARHYFSRSASELSRRQAAELAAALPRPRHWRPGSDSRAYRRRVDIALARMAKTDWLLKLL
ncbi:MAG: monofunctional biosynthetic peptidoglycan transglycosylase [Thermoanaerobaculia bacterium]|nr:monofunctional biosynthetic peptidoglycan transglycosylase [Thermoanaerobaculia bacterium]